YVGSEQLFDTATGRPVGPALRCDTMLVGSSLSPDGRRAIAVTQVERDDSLIQIWDPRTGQVEVSRRFDGRFRQVVHGPGGPRMLTGDDPIGAQRRVWDVASGSLVATLRP